MKDDIFACLTNEIKDEVMDRYVTERRLIELQIENLRAQAVTVQEYAMETGKRMARLSYWMIQPQMREKMIGLFNIQDSSPWKQYVETGFPYEVHSIQISALRDKTRLRKILLKSYHRMYQWMERYGAAYRGLLAECEAVNSNIKNFQNNSELMIVLSFLKALDTCTAEKSYFLGGNFTSQELASVDETLRFRSISFDSLKVIAPLPLNEPDRMEESLAGLAEDVYEHYHNEVKHLIRARGPKGY